MHRALQQLQDLALAGERLEQLAQPIHVGQLLQAHQPGLPGQHHVVEHPIEMVGQQRLLGQFHRLGQQRFHLGPGTFEVAQQGGADIGDGAAGKVSVEVVGDALEFAGVVNTARLQDPVLHVVVGEHQDRQHPLAVERDEIDAPERELLALGHAHHADEMGHRRQQLRRAAQQCLGARPRRQLRAQAGDLVLGQRPHLQQRVDEQPVARHGRNPAG